ncbi:MAG: condensation domain-containing protein [Mucilaginibacter sp.]|uniref:condensation domain-containing protein n=1 Tax=Mucilaginibacter sp. TaxID=1882438 RepID=UPI0031A11E15
MRRKLFFIERVMHGEGNFVFNSVLPVRVRGSFSETDLQLALKGLQKTHALLNAVIQNDKNEEPWFIVDDEHPVNIPIRITERINDDDWQTESVKEWSIPFNSYKEPLMRLIWIKGKGVSEFLLVAHHCLFDGRSILNILEEFLQFLDDPDTLIAAEVSISGISDVVPPARLNNRIHQIMAKLLLGIISMTLSLIPNKDKPAEKTKAYLLHWQFDQELSLSLMARCKAEGVTVNTIICSILFDAFKQVLPKNGLKKITFQIDIRNFNPQIKKNNIFSFALMIQVLAYTGLNFFDSARAIQKDIKNKMAKLDPYKVFILSEFAHRYFHKIVRFLRNLEPDKECMLSNLGKLDIRQHYKEFELETIFSPSVMVAEGRTTALITSTYCGQMGFSFISNSGVTYEDACAIRDKIMQIAAEHIVTESIV